MLRNQALSTNMAFRRKVLEFNTNPELTGQETCHIGEWSLIGLPQPGNKVYVFKEKMEIYCKLVKQFNMVH